MEILQRKLQAPFIQGSIDASSSEIAGGRETPVTQWAGAAFSRGREGKFEGAEGRKDTEHLPSTANPAEGSWDSGVTVALESGNFDSGIAATSVTLSLVAPSFLERDSLVHSHGPPASCL